MASLGAQVSGELKYVYTDRAAMMSIFVWILRRSEFRKGRAPSPEMRFLPYLRKKWLLNLRVIFRITKATNSHLSIIAPS